MTFCWLWCFLLREGFLTREQEWLGGFADSQPNSQESAIQQSGAQNAITARDTLSDGHSYAQTAIRGNLWRDDEF